MKAIEAVVILAFVLVDDLRNALLAVLIGSDVPTLAIMLIVVYFLSRNSKSLGSFGESLRSLETSLTAPFSKLKGSLDF